MLILKDGIFHLTGEGRISLQIPDVSIGSPTLPTEEIPDEEVFGMKFRGNMQSIALGREYGFPYISPKGWEKHRERLFVSLLDGIKETGRNMELSEEEAKAALEKEANEVFSAIKKWAERTLKRENLPKAKLEELKHKLVFYGFCK